MTISRSDAARHADNEKRPRELGRTEWASFESVLRIESDVTTSTSIHQDAESVQRVAQQLRTIIGPSWNRRSPVPISVVRRNRRRKIPDKPRITSRQLANGPIVSVKVDGQDILAPLNELTLDLLAEGGPSRALARRKEMMHRNGAYFSTTNDDLLVYETRLELQRLRCADFDPRMALLRSQPFTLYGLNENRIRRHVPDFCFVDDQGTFRIVNVKDPHEAVKPKVIDFHRWVDGQLATAGLSHEVFTGFDRVVDQNLQNIAGARVRSWLSHYPLAEIYLAWEPGDSIGFLEWRLRNTIPHYVTRASIRHLLWAGHFKTDLTQTLSSRSRLVRIA